jgi:hypothetical protein
MKTEIDVEEPVRLRTGIPFCLAVFLCLRVALSLLAVVTVHDTTFSTAGCTDCAPGTGLEAPATTGWHNALDGTDRWDAAWYLRIADQGYGDGRISAAFYPLYPLAIHGAAWILGGHELGAALLVSNLSFFAALVVLHALTEVEYDIDTARRSIVILAVFPASFFFLAPYGESLFLLLTLLSFWLARNRRWAGSAIAGAASAATRSTGVALIPALMVSAWERRRTDPTGSRRGLTAAAAIVAGPLLYGAYWLVRGNPLAPFAAQSAWGRHLAFPPVAIGHGIADVLVAFGVQNGRLAATEVLVTAMAIVPLVLWWRTLSTSYLVFAAVSLLIPLTYPQANWPFHAVPRYCAVVFPVYWVWARFLSTTLRLAVAVAISSVVWIICAVWFMNWRPFI